MRMKHIKRILIIPKSMKRNCFCCGNTGRVGELLSSIKDRLSIECKKADISNFVTAQDAVRIGDNDEKNIRF